MVLIPFRLPCFCVVHFSKLTFLELIVEDAHFVMGILSEEGRKPNLLQIVHGVPVEKTHPRKFPTVFLSDLLCELRIV